MSQHAGKKFQGRRAALGSAVGAALAASALVLSARWFWLGELAASFEWHAGLAILAAAAVCALLRAPRRAGALALVAALHLAPEARLYFGGPAQAGGSSELVLVSANVLQPNRHRAEIADALAGSGGDVIAVLELSKPMRAALEERLAAWPHRAFSPDRPWNDGVWGLGVFSKLPLAELRRVPLRDTYAPALELRIVEDGTALTLRVAHLPRPGEEWRVAARNVALGELGARLEWTGTSVLVGDLNTTSSSPFFGELLERTGLRDSRAGFGRCASWQLRSLGLPLGIAIDHALVGRDLEVLARDVFELPFSDHAGVRVRLALPPLSPARVARRS